MKIVHGLSILLLLHFLSCEKTTVTDIEKQVFTLSEDTLIIREGEYKTLNLSVNAGQVRYEINNPAPWLYVSPINGFISANQSLHLTFNIITQVISYPASATVSIITEKGTFDVYVVALAQNPTFVGPKDIQLNPGSRKADIIIINQEIEKMTWNASPLPGFLMADRTSGELSYGAVATLQLTLDTAAIRPDIDTTFDLVITINQQKQEKVHIRVQNYKPGFRLDTDVVDGEYSAIHQKYYYVSSKPKGISCIDLNTLEKTFVPLSFVPACLTLSQDEKKAAIGHDAKVTYVDLTGMKIIAEFDVDCKAIDIILAPNDYMYVFPERDQWTYLRCINTTTGNQECQDIGHLYAGSVGELHPNGKWIYFATSGITPGDIHKIDISQGTTEYLYDSPYHGHYYLGQHIKITPDGKKILTGTAFVSSDSEKQNDMLYRGSLDPDNEWQKSTFTPKNIFFHTPTDEVFIVMTRYTYSEAKPSFIYRYNTSSLELISKTPLNPIVHENGNPEAAFPLDVWVHANKIYHIVHTEDKSTWELRKISL